MPKTQIETSGLKKFHVREHVPFQLLDWVSSQYQKLEQLDEGDQAEFMIGIKNQVFQRMVMAIEQPDGKLITLKMGEDGPGMAWSVYMDEIADGDDWQMSMIVFQTVSRHMQERFEKKS